MDFDKIENSLVGNANSIWNQITDFAPKILAALFLVIIGYFLSKIIGKVLGMALNKAGLDRLSQKIGLSQMLASWRLSTNLSHFIGKVCFAFIYMIFLISTADLLEMEGLSSAIDKLVQYLPNVIGAFIVFFMASVAGHYARQAIHGASASMNIDIGKPLGQLAYYALLLIGGILAIGQLKIETAFLTHVIEIVLVSTGVAIALSLGIGSRDISKNIISGLYLRESLSEGRMIRVGEFEGELLQIKPVSFELKSEGGKIITLPNSRLLECEIIQS